MKKIIPFLFLAVLTSSCKSKATGFTLIGKWQCTESHGSDGAKEFTVSVKDGDILEFLDNNKVKDKSGNVGTYTLRTGCHGAECLHIEIPYDERFYILYNSKEDFEKIYLSPVTNEYKIICDEGCSFTYEKID